MQTTTWQDTQTILNSLEYNTKTYQKRNIKLLVKKMLNTIMNVLAIIGWATFFIILADICLNKAGIVSWMMAG